jgi:hypothetical protein
MIFLKYLNHFSNYFTKKARFSIKATIFALFFLFSRHFSHDNPFKASKKAFLHGEETLFFYQ